MKASEQTLRQIKEALAAAAKCYPPTGEAMPITDLTVQASQDTGDLAVSDDDNRELSRVNITEWAGCDSENFYGEIQPVITRCINGERTALLNAGIMKPYSILLADDDGETVADLYTVAEDTVVLDDDMIRKIDEDLDAFLEKLMKE